MRIVVILWLLMASGLRAESLTLRGATMGTTYQIKFVAPAGAVDAESLHTEVEETLAEVDQQMSTYRPDSELSRFNRAPADEWFPVSEATAKVTAAAQEISEKTGGAMDVTVGPLVRLWHFGPTGGDAAKKQQFVPPAEDEIAKARRKVGYRKLDVRMQPPALRKEVDGLEVDLSSIAPGYAIDRLAHLVHERGIDDFMVEIGGEVRAAGTRADGKVWRVGIEKPSKHGRELQMSLPLHDAAIATAGDYRKFFEHGGQRYSHIIDPATGRPVKQELVSVTVIAETCMAADGWDTPLLVLGPARGFEIATKHGIAAMFISGGNGGDVRKTTAWRELNLTQD
jgi:thiamine biosynthesis lipoprotein